MNEQANVAAMPAQANDSAPIVNEKGINAGNGAVHELPPAGPVKQKRKRPQAKANVKVTKAEVKDAKRTVRVTDEQNASYCEMLLTGDFSAGQPFASPLGKIAFTKEQKQAQREARREHRLTVSAQPAKEAIMKPLTENKDEILLSFRQGKNQDKTLKLRSFVNHPLPFAVQRAIHNGNVTMTKKQKAIASAKPAAPATA